MGGFVNEDLGADYVAVRGKERIQVLVTILLGQVVDEEVASFRSFLLLDLLLLLRNGSSGLKAKRVVVGVGETILSLHSRVAVQRTG